MVCTPLDGTVLCSAAVSAAIEINAREGYLLVRFVGALGEGALRLNAAHGNMSAISALIFRHTAPRFAATDNNRNDANQKQAHVCPTS